MTRDYSFDGGGIWGEFNFWLNGKKLGDKTGNFGCIAPVAGALDAIRYNFSHLWNDRLSRVGLAKAFDILDYSLFGYIGNEYIEHHSEYEDFFGESQFLQHSFLANWGEFFDEEPKYFLLGEDENVVVFWREYESSHSSEIQSVSIHKEIFLRVVDEFNEWFDNEELLDK